MSAMVFGLEKPCHLRLSAVRETDSMNGGVYEEKAAELILKPRVRTYREKAGRTSIGDASWEKAQARSEAVEQMKRDWKKIGERCVVRCEDGNFTMPRLSIVFRDGTGEGRDFLGEGGEAGRSAALPAGKKRGGA